MQLFATAERRNAFVVVVSGVAGCVCGVGV
jgi:hypothetical protein